MPTGTNSEERTARQLSIGDLERVIAIDRAHVGHARRRFFEKRMAAATRNPHDFIQIGVGSGGALRGFAIARILRGEFGYEHAIAVLDAVGVEPESRESGVGQHLMAALAAAAARIGVRSVHSQVAWKDQRLLRFFHVSGFELAPRIALERAAGDRLDEASEEV